MQTVAELENILADLQGRRRAAEALLASITTLRREKSFDAAQGDPEAIATLGRAEKTHRRVSRDLEQLQIAETGGRRRLAEAREREAAEQVEVAKLEFDKVGDELLVRDGQFLRALDVLRKEIDARGELIGQLLEMDRGQLSSSARATLASREPLAAALADVLGKALGPYLRQPGPEMAGAVFLELDYRALGREAPDRQPTAIERALRRGLEPSRFGNVA